MAKKVAVLVGSLRKESYNRKIALALQGMVPEKLALSIAEIGGLPFYNEDQETATPPEAWVAFRKQIGEADAVLFVTPEYNRGVPGVLKNAVDVGSRPYGKTVFSKKPGAVISSSPGLIGGALANHHLRQSLTAVNMAVMAGPEVYLSNVNKMLDEQGKVVNETTVTFLRTFMDGFASWIEQNKA